MAYTIISQNNNTTTLTDGVNTITVPSRVNLTSGNFTLVEVNNNMATLEDGDGNVYRDIPCVVNLVDAGGGGGTVDKSKIVNADTIPEASASNAGYVYLYTGTTNASYTHGYVYQNVKSATYTGTVSFEAATLSGTTVACSGDNFATFLTEAGADPTPIVSGTMTYEADATGWRLVGKDSNGNTVTTFMEYVEDYQDAGFTFTGTPQDGDVIAFTCSVTEASATYTWTRIDVQPAPEALPDQTGQSGKFLTTDGSSASWSDKPLVNADTHANSLAIGGSNTSGTNNTLVGSSATSYGGNYNTIIGASSQGRNASTILGFGVQAAASANAVVIRSGAQNSTYINLGVSDTFTWIYKTNQYVLCESDGTIPHARLTNAVSSTTVTIAAADWNGGTTVSKTVSGLTATSVVWVAPEHASQSDYTSAGVYASSQTTDTLEFSCTTTPTNALTVTVVYC